MRADLEIERRPRRQLAECGDHLGERRRASEVPRERGLEKLGWVERP